ncbi:MAG: CPBP family intramembrane metalloprotease [Desulfobacterales bacterium]|nr:CPBP family intramembrane metalloprotease [Desulfobacterales bacterium]
MSISKSKILLLFTGLLPFLINGFYNPTIVKIPTLYWFIEILTWVAFPIWIYWYGIKKQIFSRNIVGINLKIFNKRNLPLLFLFSIIAILTFPIVYNSSFIYAQNHYPINYLKVNFSYSQILPGRGIKYFFILLYFSATAGIVEEFYLKGLLRSIFKNTFFSILAFVIISATIFSSLHWEGGVWGLFATFIFGIFSATFYATTKNLWPNVIGHFATDYLWFTEVKFFIPIG